jgi:hypothetical protein
MSPNTRLYASRLVLSALAGGLCLSLAGGLTACKTVDLSDDTVRDTVSKDTGTAVLRITNNISLFSDSLDFYLYPGTAFDFTNAVGGRKIGGVGVGRTRAFTVPAGIWKLAFTDQAGQITAMRSLSSDDWVKSMLSKDGDYSLILSSEGQDIRWDPTFPTDPSLR